MATDQRLVVKPTLQQAKERKKKAFVVLLGAALCAVLYVQFGHRDPAVQSSTSSALDVAQESAQPTMLSVSPAMAWTPSLSREYVTVSLPTRTIDEIVLRHPFFQQPSEETKIAGEVSSGPLIVSAIYATPKRSAAIVGSSIVRDGDNLPDGRRLVAASPRGLQTQSPAALSTKDGK